MGRVKFEISYICGYAGNRLLLNNKAIDKLSNYIRSKKGKYKMDSKWDE